MGERRKQRQRGKNTLPNPYSLIETGAANCSIYSHPHTTCVSRITDFLPNQVRPSVSTHSFSLHHCHLPELPWLEERWDNMLGFMWTHQKSESCFECRWWNVGPMAWERQGPWGTARHSWPVATATASPGWWWMERNTSCTVQNLCHLDKSYSFLSRWLVLESPWSPLGFQAGELMILLIMRIYSRAAGLIDRLTGSTFRVESALKLEQQLWKIDVERCRVFTAPLESAGVGAGWEMMGGQRNRARNKLLASISFFSPGSPRSWGLLLEGIQSNGII